MEDFGFAPPLPLVQPENNVSEEAGIEGASGESSSKDLGFTPITARTRSKVGLVIQAPLRQAIGAAGLARIKVPFATNDLDSWKEAVKGNRDDPEVIAKRFELIVENLDPDWKDIDIMLDALTETEKQLVVKTTQTQVHIQTIDWGTTGYSRCSCAENRS